MDLKIKGKKALITGAGRGIGKSIALELNREGVEVAIISRTKSDLEDIFKKMNTKNNYFIIGDLSEEGAPKIFFDDLEKNFGSVDILVNNLGGTLEIKDPYCSIEDWRKMYRLNLEVAIELNNLIIPHMKEKKWGRIVNISSISGSENQGPVPYCSFKSALNAYTRSMGRILASEGVIMSAVSPGVIITEEGYWDTTMKKNPEYVEKYIDERMAIKRFGKPEEIAPIVAFLCSEHASFCVGSLFPADGGQGKCFF